MGAPSGREAFGTVLVYARMNPPVPVQSGVEQSIWLGLAVIVGVVLFVVWYIFQRWFFP